MRPATMIRCSFSLLMLAMPCASASAGDWAHWRGPEQNGVARDKDLPERFSLNPAAPDSNLIWKAPYGGRTTPIVQGGHVYLINKDGEGLSEQERVMCFDADTGKVLWQHKFNVFHAEIVSVRLGWTNLCADPETGNVYAHGTQGFLIAFNKDGKVLWTRSLTEEYGRISGYGGRLTSPIVDENLVIIGMVNGSWGEYASGANRFMAFDKHTGTPVWLSPGIGRPPRTYYSNPVVAVINGERLVISGAADGAVHALRARTGEPVWKYVYGAGAVNCSPVVSGTRVYIGHGEENPDNNIQGRVICLDAAKVTNGKPELVWKTDDLKIKFASPIIHEDRLYVCDEVACMYCLDAKTGKEIWQFTYGTDCKGSPVLADGKIYVAEVNAKFHILKPEDKQCTRLYAQRFRSPDGVSAVEINGSPAVANGRVYFCTNYEMYCLGKKDRPVSAVVGTASKKDDDAPANAKTAFLQVVPADVALRPGESADFKVRAFDNHGHFLREVKAQFSLGSSPLPEGIPPPQPQAGQPAPAGPPTLRGTITPEGKLTADDKVPEQAGLVVATADGISGKARVRVVPALPYKQDFERIPEGRVPPDWVNCAGKFAVQKKGDSNVLVKLANTSNSVLARANAYIGTPSMTDYTIEADVLGKKKGDDMPDLGIVANRYTLMLTGTQQSLRIISWEALPRVDKTIGWPWKPDVWYRMKLTVDVQGEKAVVRGKVWPRDQAEPKDWTIEFTDPTPNKEGCPALYGWATGATDTEKGAEIYYDNVSITPNKKAVGGR